MAAPKKISVGLTAKPKVPPKAFPPKPQPRVKTKGSPLKMK